MSKARTNLYKLHDGVGFMTADAILESDNEELQNDFFKMLDRLNEQDYHLGSASNNRNVEYLDNRGERIWH